MRLLLIYIALFSPLFAALNSADSVRGYYAGIEGNELADTLNKVAADFVENDPKVAYELISDALKISLENSYNYGKAQSYLNLGEYYYRTNSYDSALTAYANSKYYLIQEERTEKLANVYYGLGRSYDSRSDFDSAKYYYGEAFDIANHFEQDEISGLALLAIGKIERIGGLIEASFEKQIKAYEILSEANYLPGIAQALKNIGVHYKNSGELDESLHFLRRALLKYRKLESWRGEATTLGYIGLIHQEKGNVDSALYYHESALKIRELYSDIDGTAISLENISDLLLKKEDAAAAEPYIIKSIKLREKTGNLYGLASANIKLAKILMSDGLYVSAKEKLEYSIHVSDEHQFNILLLESYKILRELFLIEEDYRSAYLYLKLYSALSDSVKSIERDRTISALNTHYINDKKLKDYEILTAQKEMRVGLVVFFGATSLFAIVFVIWLFRKNKLYNNALKTIKEQNFQLEDLNTELSTKNQTLTELNFTKDKFVSIIAHDLRNPFVSILGYTSMLTGNEPVDNADKEIMISQIDKAAHRAYTLLENLLQWGMSQTGKIKMTTEKLSVKFLVLESVNQIRFQAEKKNITVNYLDENEIFILADQPMILTVIRNLLSNAVKFTPSGGSIQIWTEIRKKMAVINISDSGVGLTKEEINYIFSIGRGKDGTEKEKGSGLGLVLCKEFIERNSGEIFVESEPEKGSIFSFSLPLFVEHTPDIS